jgi:8-oxo-dGTP diphosphatase
MKKHAVMLYIIKDNKILFLVRDKANDTVHRQGMLLSVGGKVEEGESLEEAVIREAKEEAGITIKNPVLKAVIYFRKFGTELNDWIDFLYVANDYDSEPRTGNEGSFVWHDINNINNLNLYSQDKVYLDLMMKHKFFVAEFLCDGHEMVDYKVLKAL